MNHFVNLLVGFRRYLQNHSLIDLVIALCCVLSEGGVGIF